MLKRILLLFFVSGALGLGYQVLWSKFVLLFVGVSSWSYAIVLAAFMTGLALGSRYLGRAADRAASPLRLFGYLELGIGAYAVMYPALADAAGRAYIRLAAAHAGDASDARLVALKITFAGLLLVPPTFLMGGTLPALVRHASTSAELIGQRASQLYSVNAAGAVLGALGMAMTVIPLFGLRGSLMALALGNAAIGALALAGARRPATMSPGPSAPAAEPPAAPLVMNPRVLAPVVAFVAGALAFALEIAWTRAFGVIMGSSTQSFALILAAFIAGIAGGSALLARHEARVRHPIAAFGVLQLGAAILILVPLPIYPYLRWVLGRIAHDLPATTLGYQAWGLLRLATGLAIMTIPCLALGVSVPLLVKAVARRVEAAGADTGRVLAWNTAGNVVGALGAGMIMLPLIGAERLIAACALASAACGALTLGLGSTRAALPRAAAAGMLGFAVVAALAIALPRWDNTWLTVSSFRRAEMGTWEATRRKLADRDVIYMRDDPAANVIVLAGDSKDGTSLALLVNGKADASNLSDQPTQLLLGHLPMMLHPQPESVLVVGLASGVTSGAILHHPVGRLDVVDIVACMPEAAAFFDRWSGDPLSDARTTFITDDARSLLMTTRRTYDVVVSEPSNPWTAGTGSLYSTEFYQAASARLAPGGVYAQWLQAYEMSDHLLAAVLRSFRAVFPHVTLWETASMDTVLIGSLEPLTIDRTRIETALARPGVAEQLGPFGFTSPEAVLFLQRFGPETVDWVAALSAIENTDDNLLLEHEGPRDLFLLRTPTVLEFADERRSVAPTLAWTRPLRDGALDPLVLPRLMSHRVHGSEALLAAWLAAVMRDQELAFGDLPAEIRAALPPDIGEPMATDELVAAIGTAAYLRDLPRLALILGSERSAIAIACAINPEVADAWDRALGSAAEASTGRIAAILRLAQSDALAAAGRTDAALAALRAAMSMAPMPDEDEVMTRACRLGDAQAVDQLARELLAATGSPRIERFLDLRARR